MHIFTTSTDIPSITNANPLESSAISINENTNHHQRPIIAGLNDYSVDPPKDKRMCCHQIPARYALAIWAFFGFVCLYAMRVNLSVAIVAMVAPQSASNQSVEACPSENSNSTKPASDYEFHWEPSDQGIILGAFFYGYVVTQVVGGNLAEKFGGKWIFGGGIFLSGILTLLTPVAARIDFKLLVALRILIGMASGPSFPSAAAIWGKWIPMLERSTIPPASQTGTNLGIIFATPMVSLMSDSGFLGGWPSAFYVFGALGCIWFGFWCFFGFNSPDEHPRISIEERLFLHRHIVPPTVKRVTPWKKIATCVPLYGIAIMHICNNYIYYTLLTSLPTYFSTILKFDLHQNGIISAMPYFAQLLITLFVGRIVDKIRESKRVSITVLRKVQTIIGTIGTTACLIAVGYTGCNHFAAVAFCVLAVGFLGFHTCGAIISHLDVAPNYAGTLVGITNSLAAIPGFVGPYVVGALTNHNQTVEAWRLIFNISAGIGAVGCLAYCVLFHGEEQSWNRIEESKS